MRSACSLPLQVKVNRSNEIEKERKWEIMFKIMNWPKYLDLTRTVSIVCLRNRELVLLFPTSCMNRVRLSCHRTPIFREFALDWDWCASCWFDSSTALYLTLILITMPRGPEILAGYSSAPMVCLLVWNIFQVSSSRIILFLYLMWIQRWWWWDMCIALYTLILLLIDEVKFCEQKSPCCIECIQQHCDFCCSTPEPMIKSASRKRIFMASISWNKKKLILKSTRWMRAVQIVRSAVDLQWICTALMRKATLTTSIFLSPPIWYCESMHWHAFWSADDINISMCLAAHIGYWFLAHIVKNLVNKPSVSSPWFVWWRFSIFFWIGA